jgi:hypothetical protein
MQRERAVTSANSATPTMTAPGHVDDDLDRDVERARATIAAESAVPTSVIPDLEPTHAPAPRQAMHMPMSAPVSREVPTASGARNDSRVTLTAEERSIARTSMSWLPAHEAERQYAENKIRWAKMKSAGYE